MDSILRLEPTHYWSSGQQGFWVVCFLVFHFYVIMDRSLASLVTRWLKKKKIHLPMKETQVQVQSLGGEDHLEKETATHSSILAWKLPMDRGTWRAAVHGVAKNQTWLSDWTTTRTNFSLVKLWKTFLTGYEKNIIAGYWWSHKCSDSWTFSKELDNIP